MDRYLPKRDKSSVAMFLTTTFFAIILILCIFISSSFSISIVNAQSPNPPQSCPIFSNTINLSNNPSKTQSPWVAGVGSNVYLIYKERHANNIDADLFFKRSTDGGASFGKATKLAGSIDYKPRIAAAINNVYVVWQSFNPLGTFFVRSTDSGASFEKPIKLGSNPADTVAPELAISGKNNVYVVWRENSPGDIFFKRSIDGGKGFGKTINLSNNAEHSTGHKVAVSNDGNNVYVVWDDETTQSGSNDIFFRRSSNGGTSFDNTINLSNNAGESRGSKVTTATSGKVTNDNVYVTWVDDLSSPNANEILYLRSTNGGTSFGNTINLSNDPGNSLGPVAAAYGDNHFYIAWPSYDDHEILYKRSVNGGTSFGNTINLSNDPGKSAYALIAVSSNNNVNVLWKDDTPSNEDVFFRKSSPGGGGFGCTLNLSDSMGDEYGADLAIVKGGNNIFTAWNDNNYDIYFKTSPPP